MVADNEELKKLTQWHNANQVSLNVGKTKFMVFYSARKVVRYPVLVINNTPIERVTNFNYLGHKLSCHLQLPNKYKKNVDFQKTLSDPLTMITSIPQGSISGLLIFLIYINDLSCCSLVFSMIMYADDTTLFCNFNDPNITEQTFCYFL